MERTLKKKRKINGQKIFNFVSFIFILICILWYGGRFIYFYLDSKKVLTEESNTFARVIKKQNHDNDHLKQVNQTYYFYGNVDNNYVRYSNLLWRIVRVGADNTVVLVTDQVVGNLAMGNKESTYQDSNIMTWLNLNTENGNSGVLEKNLSNKESVLVKNEICMDMVDDIEKITCETMDKEHYVGLLSVQDYIRTGGSKSFIHNGRYTYFGNQNKEKEYWYLNQEGKLDVTSSDEMMGFKAVITLSPSLEVKDGNGSLKNPYTIAEDQNYFGSYVQLGNDMWRVYEVQENTLKLVMNHTLEDSSQGDKVFKYIYSKRNFKHNDTVYGSLAYYLNQTYYNSLGYRSILLENTYVNGYYGEDNDFKLEDVYQNTMETKITVPSITDVVLNDELEGYATDTGLSDGSSLIYIQKGKGSIGSNSVLKESAVVPCISIDKSNLKLGSGTESDPYRMES